MKCYHHPHADAVATCSVCGKGLCQKCASLYNVPYCSYCAKQVANDSKKEIKSGFIKGIIWAAIFVFIDLTDLDGSASDILGTVVWSILAFFAPFGWRLLNKITSEMFLFLPVVGWILYGFIKGVLSLLIGWIALPILLRKSKQLQKTIDDTEKVR